MSFTEKEYKTLDDAYNFFNNKLWNDELPDVLITLQRKPHSLGYYHHNRLATRQEGKELSEIALNPDGFSGRDDIEILSTLAHEMAHVWQFFTDEKPSRPGYHNKSWAYEMERIGLMPSSTGDYGGKKTGQKMSHYIIDGGLFELHCGAFLAGGKSIGIESPPIQKEAKERKKTRFKFVCPDCMQNCWGKKTGSFMCGECEIHMLIDDEE